LRRLRDEVIFEQRKENMSNDRTLSLSTVIATIRAPIEKVNIADWVLHLPDAEYQRCAEAHIAAGATTTDDGRPMSINVETIGDALVVQHYVAKIHEPHFCRMVSISDSMSPAGSTKLHVVWELSVKRIDEQTCEYTNHVHSTAIDQTLEFLKAHNIPFETARRTAASFARTQSRGNSEVREEYRTEGANGFRSQRRKSNEGPIRHQQFRNCVLALGSYTPLLAPH
jgi:hypothetical protein